MGMTSRLSDDQFDCLPRQIQDALARSGAGWCAVSVEEAAGYVCVEIHQLIEAGPVRASVDGAGEDFRVVRSVHASPLSADRIALLVDRAAREFRSRHLPQAPRKADWQHEGF